MSSGMRTARRASSRWAAPRSSQRNVRRWTIVAAPRREHRDGGRDDRGHEHGGVLTGRAPRVHRW